MLIGFNVPSAARIVLVELEHFGSEPTTLEAMVTVVICLSTLAVVIPLTM